MTVHDAGTVLRTIFSFIAWPSSRVQFAESPYFKYPRHELPGGFITVFVILFLFILGFFLVFMTDPPPKPRIIFGKVVTENNQPVKGADISFLGAGSSTDLNGFFKITFATNRDRGQLSVKHPGYSGAIDREILITSPDTINVRVVLPDSKKTRTSRPLTVNTDVPQVNTPNTENQPAILQSSVQKVWIDATWKNLLGKRSEFSRDGLELVDIETYALAGKRVFAGTWSPTGYAHHLWKADDWNSFVKKRNEFRNEGLNVIDIEVYQEGGKNRFVGIWRSGIPGQNRIWAGSDWETILKKYNEFGREGYLLIDLEAYVSAGKLQYAAIWEAASGEQAIWKASGGKTEFLTKIAELEKQSLRLVDLEIFLEAGQQKYLGIWRTGNDRQKFLPQVPFETFNARRKDNAAQGFTLIDLEVDTPGKSKLFSGIWREKSE